MGLTGRTAKRRRRYYGWARNDFGAIDRKYNLNIPADRFDAACWAYANMKVEQKRWRGLRGFFNALGKNPGIIVGLVVGVVFSGLSFGAGSALSSKQLALAIAAAAAAATAAGENARKLYSLEQYARAINSMRFTPSLTSAAKRQQARRSLNALIFYAYANYPQGTVYESEKLTIHNANIPQQDIVYNQAYFGGKGIYRAQTPATKTALNDTTQNRQGKNIAGGIEYHSRTVQSDIPHATIDNPAQTIIRANSNRANARAQEISEGFQALSNALYNAGGQLLNDYEFVLLRDIAQFFQANIAIEQRENTRQYNRGLRPHATTYAAAFERVKKSIKDGTKRLEDLDAAIKAEAEAKLQASKEIQESDTTTLYEKANDYYYNCLARIENFMLECEPDGDMADAVILQGAKETQSGRISMNHGAPSNQITFTAAPDFAWIMPTATLRRDDVYGEYYMSIEYEAAASAYAASKSTFKEMFGIATWEDLETLDKNELIRIYETFFKDMQITASTTPEPLYNTPLTAEVYRDTVDAGGQGVGWTGFVRFTSPTRPERYYLRFVFEQGAECRVVYAANTSAANFDADTHAEFLADFANPLPKSPALNGYDYNKLDEDDNSLIIDATPL